MKSSFLVFQVMVGIYAIMMITMVDAGWQRLNPYSTQYGSTQSNALLQNSIQLTYDPNADFPSHNEVAVQIYNGKIDLVQNTNGLVFDFDVTLDGGQYQCIHFDGATGGGGAELNISFSDSSTVHYTSDLEIFVTTSVTTNLSLASLNEAIIFGGNDIGDIGGTQDYEWPASYKTQNLNPVSCKFGMGPIELNAGFNSVCLASTCTNSPSFTNGYCSGSPATFSGSLLISKFSTTTPTVTSTIDPNCRVGESSIFERLHYPTYETSTAGAIEIIENTNNIEVNFDLTLVGGYYQCLPINATTSAGKYHRFTINYQDQIDNFRYIYDPQIIFAFNGNVSFGEYFGGNNQFPIARTKFGSWRSSYEAPHLVNTCYSFDAFVQVSAGFDAICVMNTCTETYADGPFCSDSSRFIGSLIISGFSTTTPKVTDTIHPACISGTVSPTIKPTSAPTIPKTYEPTCPPVVTNDLIPTSQPTIKPTHFPTHSKKPSVRPTHFPTHVKAPNPTNKPSYCTCNCYPGPRPAFTPTHFPTNTKTPTIKPTHFPTHKK